MRSRSHVLAQRLTRRSAVQLLGAWPLLASAALAAGPATLRTSPPALAATATDAADRLFRAGYFAEADAAYSQVLAHDPHNMHALAQHAYVALLANRLTEARNLLQRVVQQQPSDRLALRNLAATLYRLDDFAQAAPVYYQLGNTRMARQLASFAGRVPYQVHGPEVTRLPFLVTDPLPMVNLSVNGSTPVPCTLDTGAPALSIDPAFAARAGVTEVAPGLGRADTVTLGAIEIRNVPVAIMGRAAPPRVQTPRAAPPLPAAPVGPVPQGTLGTAVLNHFLFTMDYAHGALVLRRKTHAQLQQLVAQVKDAITMPFWMAEDHFMVAWGTFESLAPGLFLIDTGAMNTGFVTTEAMARAAHVTLDRSKARRVILGIINGHPNETTIYPFTVTRLALGMAVRCDVPGTVGSAPPLPFGFDTGGTISHAFFRDLAVTFDFLGMRLFLSGAAASCGSGG